MIIARSIDFRVVNFSKPLSFEVATSPYVSIVSPKSCITFAITVLCRGSLCLSCPSHCFLSIFLHLLFDHGLIFRRLSLPRGQCGDGFGFVKLAAHQIVVIFLEQVLLVYPSQSRSLQRCVRLVTLPPKRIFRLVRDVRIDAKLGQHFKRIALLASFKLELLGHIFVVTNVHIVDIPHHYWQIACIWWCNLSRSLVSCLPVGF